MPSRSNIADATIIGALLKDVTRFGVTVQNPYGYDGGPGECGANLGLRSRWWC